MVPFVFIYLCINFIPSYFVLHIFHMYHIIYIIHHPCFMITNQRNFFFLLLNAEGNIKLLKLLVVHFVAHRHLSRGFFSSTRRKKFFKTLVLRTKNITGALVLKMNHESLHAWAWNIDAPT